jgi:predicted TIM-barrel fold metal-dependent hydrolase
MRRPTAETTGKPLAAPERILDVHNHMRTGRDADDVVALMDEHRVERMLLLGTPGAPANRNDAVLRAVRRHPDRFAGGVFADPRDGEAAVEEVRRYHAEGFRVVKLFPNHGYYPDDDALRPFFDAVAELKMAVLSHCGWLSPKAGAAYASYYSHPSHFEKLIRLHPETVFILAHMGGIAGFLETVMLTTRTPNTYVDCSPGQGLWVLESAGPLVASIPPERLMFGCDSFDYAGLLPRYVAALTGAGFADHLDAIFYANARGLLERIGAIEPAGQGERGD